MTPRAVSDLLVGAYPRTGTLTRQMIRFRPYICPFHDLLPHIPRNGSVLEVGCGVGMMSVLLAHCGATKRALGIDVSEKAIETARSSVAPQGVDLRFRSVEASEGYPDGFDTVVCIDVLHHVLRQDQRAFVERLVSVRPGKTLVFKDVSPKPAWKAFASILHDLVLSRQFIAIPREAEVREWIEEAGMTVVVDRRLDTLWYSHYLLVAEKNEGGDQGLPTEQVPS
jgi:2-polyprenyl-3-methyl-5-hydroxy-6-metoxy-1,4-benzoquinol methylase